MAASGFYNHLLFKLQYEFKLNIESMTDCFYRRYSSAAGTDIYTKSCISNIFTIFSLSLSMMV